MTIVIDYSSVMKEIQISTFKAQCLQILDEVNRTEEAIIVTRRGQPLVVISPINTKPNQGFGIGSGTAKITGDILSPAGDESDWEVLG